MSEKTFVPVNRHLLIRPVDLPQENQTEHGILLPSDYKPEQSEYAVVKILDWAEDVKLEPIDTELGAIVERSMIKRIEHDGDTVHLVLENYVLCFVVEDE